MKTTTPVFKSRRQQKLWEKEKKRIEARKSKSYVNHAPFRYVERNFKSRVSAPDFTDVVDFQNRDRNTQANNDNIVHVDLKDDLKNLSSLFGSLEDHPSSRDAYVLKNVPGLIIIPNAFSPKAQRQLVKQCLSIYPQPPNTSNLDTHYIIPSTGLWPLYKAQEEGVLTPNDPGFFVPKKEVQSETSDTYVDSEEEEEDVKSKAHQAKDLGPKAPPTACSDDFKPVMKEEKPDPLPAPGVPLLPPNELVRKLRWVTLGYQYHWPTKTYHLDRQYPFPEDVSELTKAVVTAIEGIGYQSEKDDEVSWLNEYKGEDFKAEAGVVNYYQYRDALMGHVDRSELNMEAPLISLSLGHDCIYLIGGPTRDTVPIPLLLRSGDIIAMTGPCRKSFHGVPLIIENTLPDFLSNQNQYDDSPDWKLFGDFMSTSRINLNIRQVYPRDYKK